MLLCFLLVFFFFFKQKTAYEMRISDWSSDVCSSDLRHAHIAMAAGLAWRYGRGDRLPFVLLFAAAWILTEWLRANLFTGFAWNPLGVIWMAVPPLADSARWIGTYGLSGLTILIDRKSTRLNSSH